MILNLISLVLIKLLPDSEIAQKTTIKNDYSGYRKKYRVILNKEKAKIVGY